MVDFTEVRRVLEASDECADTARIREYAFALLRRCEGADRLLRETIATFYWNDNDEPCWADTGLGKSIADHLGVSGKTTEQARALINGQW